LSSKTPGERKSRPTTNDQGRDRSAGRPLATDEDDEGHGAGNGPVGTTVKEGHGLGGSVRARSGAEPGCPPRLLPNDRHGTPPPKAALVVMRMGCFVRRRLWHRQHRLLGQAAFDSSCTTGGFNDDYKTKKPMARPSPPCASREGGKDDDMSPGKRSPGRGVVHC
jgi:hypothetical protein